LLGVAQSDEEMRKVFSAVSKIRGVKKVVNHVILVSDARRT
jgi:osmotically-inducible protein OsmY